MNKKHLTFIYLIINVVIIAAIGLLDPHIKDIGKVFYKIQLPWIAGGFLSMGMFWLMDALIIYYVVASIYRRKSFLKCLRVTIIGQYYNSVTPFASGGQPSQIYYMNKYGIPVGFASSSLMIKFLIYQVVLSIYCLMAFGAKAGFIMNYSIVVFWISMVGFVINAGAVFLIYSLSVNKGMIKKIIYKLLGFLAKIRLIKDLEKTMERLQHHVDDFHGSICLIRGNFKAIITMGILTFIQLTFFFSITYFIYRALGLSKASWWEIISVQSFLYLAVSYFPTPGAAGASEFGFYGFFKLFFSMNVIFVAMLLWRIMSYYMNIVVGGIVIFLESMHHFIRRSPSQ